MKITENSPPVKDKLHDVRIFHDWLKDSSPKSGNSVGKLLAVDNQEKSSCYDAYYCHLPSLAFLNHILMGGIAIFLAILGILLNTLLIPIFNMVGIRSSATVYMTGIAVCDTISLILVVVLVVVKNLSSTFNGQLTMYQNFSGYLIPFGWPVKELVELMSLWLVVALLLDRFLYRKNFTRFNQNLNRSRCVKLLLFLIIFFAIYTIPKFLKYKLVEKMGPNQTHQVKVMHTLIAEGTSYQNIMFWLKLPIELALPYIFICTLVCFIGFSLRRRKGSFTYNSSCRMVSHDKMEVRESTNTHLALYIGILILICKLPALLLNGFAALSKQSNARDSFHLKLKLIAEFFEVCGLSLKPLIYIIFGSHLRKVSCDMLLLCVRPTKTREIVLAGGLGNTVEMKDGCASMNRSHTSTTLVDNSTLANRSMQSAIFLGQDDILKAYTEKVQRGKQAAQLDKSAADEHINMRPAAACEQSKSGSSEEFSSEESVVPHSERHNLIGGEDQHHTAPGSRRQSRASRSSFSNQGATVHS